jgi:hypothetical protein
MDINALREYHVEQLYNNDKKHILNKKKEKEKAEIVPPNMFENIDEYVFQKRWHKLQQFHQKIKLEEYINSLDPPLSSENKQKTISNLHNGINNKKLTKSADVKYDPIGCKITEITKFDDYLSTD